MRYTGVTVFVLFFGISLLDALSAGHWMRALFWTGMGGVFWALDRGLPRLGNRTLGLESRQK